MPTNPLLVLATLVALRGRWQCLYKLSGKDDGIPVILLHGGLGFTVKAVRAQLNKSDPR